MTDKEKIDLIQKAIDRKTANDKNIDDFYKIFNSCDFPLIDEYHKLFDEYLKLIEEKLGDSKTNWVSWYIFDNDCGKKNFKVTVNGVEFKIGSIKQLVTKVLNVP
jgi:hypothetical protein